MDVKDSNGTILNNCDLVHLIKDLKVKGSPLVLKKGKVIKIIKFTDNKDEGLPCGCK